jgi:hypothetical protein
MKKVHLLTVLALAALSSTALAGDGKLKVFILAGQSNMEGHAKVETFDYIGDDPATAPLLKKMRGPDGQPRISENVCISYLTGREDENGEGFGKLTAGYGSRTVPGEDGGKIGPEFTFGLTMEEALDGPVLIIKTAWGGKSLFYDFRPPSAGLYQRSTTDIEKERRTADRSGHYYRLMIDHVKSVLKDPKRICPEYDPDAGYEIAGFAWFQGWNDMVNRDVYPMPSGDSDTTRFAKYSEWMADFIRDVRTDLDAPDMPLVIGVMGVGGLDNEKQAPFREAMAAPASLPEFTGNVAAVETAPFWDEPLSELEAKRGEVKQMAYFLKKEHKDHANRDGIMTPQQQKEYLAKFEAELISPEEADLRQRGASNAGYHYLGCAKTMALIGQAFANSLLEMQP